MSPTSRAYSRRAVMRALGSASTIAVVAATVPSSPAQAYDPGPEETKSRYRESDHVKAFYRTNGYETLKK
jgi:hypothetical protein